MWFLALIQRSISDATRHFPLSLTLSLAAIQTTRRHVDTAFCRGTAGINSADMTLQFLAWSGEQRRPVFPSLQLLLTESAVLPLKWCVGDGVRLMQNLNGSLKSSLAKAKLSYFCVLFLPLSLFWPLGQGGLLPLLRLQDRKRQYTCSLVQRFPNCASWWVSRGTVGFDLNYGVGSLLYPLYQKTSVWS